jgi:arginase
MAWTLATATGRCWVELARSIEGFEPVPEQAVVLLGARDLDPGEEAALARSKVVRLSAPAAAIGIEPVLQSLAQEMAQFYLHLDLDALDPSEGRANSYSARGGFSRADMQKVLSTIAKDLSIKALTIAGYDPSYDKDGTVRATAFAAISTVLNAVGQAA